MMEFNYGAEGLSGSPPPSLSSTAKYRRRPTIPIRVYGRSGRFRYFPKALLDTGADETVFPWTAAALIGAVLLPASGHEIVWHGTAFPLRFSHVELLLTSKTASCRWPAIVGFSSAPLAYPLLGIAGCLEYFDANFRGEDHIVELAPAPGFAGNLQILP